MPEAPVTKRNLILILATTTALSALALSAARARDVPKVATGFVASILCSEIFVSGQPSERILAETTDALPGSSLIKWALNATIDRSRRDVTVTLLGFGKSHAVYREVLAAISIMAMRSPMRRCPLPRSDRLRRCWRISRGLQ
jgi:hypothetical protein